MRLFRHFVAVLLLVGGSVPSPTAAQDRSPSATLATHPYAAHVAEAARRFGIPEAWIWAVMRVESNGNARAFSRAGAMGLMQIMPATWAELRAIYGLGPDPFDVRDNIMAGAAYLCAMHDRYGDPAAMLAAYNAGPGRYDEYLRGRPLPPETRAYLTRLASIIGDTGDVRVAAAPPSDPFAWRRGALFVRVSSGGDDAVAPQSGSPNDAAEPSAERPSGSSGAGSVAAISARHASSADSLFVPRASAGRPR